MASTINPFTPVFGTVPAVFAGRQEILDDLIEGLEGGTGNPNRCTLIIGPRGSGKTAMLRTFVNEASSFGWISANVSCISGMLEDVYNQSKAAASDFVETHRKSHITSVSGGGFSISRSIDAEYPPNWRLLMSRLLDELAENSIGLVITVDEVDIRVDELRVLVTTYQHFVGEGRDVVLILAGLPKNVVQMVMDGTISFLRRATHRHLGLIPPHVVRETIKKTVKISSRTIDESALQRATQAAGGFPYLIQLVGFHMWRQNPDNTAISLEDAEDGITFARAEMNPIFEIMLREISGQDRNFLLAMIEDEEDSSVSEIAQRLGVSMSYVGQYRLRLIAQGIVGERGRGKIGFTIPMLKEYLLENFVDREF